MCDCNTLNIHSADILVIHLSFVKLTYKAKLAWYQTLSLFSDDCSFNASGRYTHCLVLYVHVNTTMMIKEIIICIPLMIFFLTIIEQRRCIMSLVLLIVYALLRVHMWNIGLLPFLSSLCIYDLGTLS